MELLLAFSLGRASDAHSTGIWRAAKESWIVVLLDMFSQWFAGISRGLQHPFPAACFVWRPWISDSNTHDPWNKSGELVFQGSILQVAKFQRANHMQMTMADAVGCSWCRWSQAWGRGMEFTSCGLLPWIVATEGLGELTGCWLKQTECCPESHCWVRTWGRVCTEKRY